MFKRMISLLLLMALLAGLAVPAMASEMDAAATTESTEETTANIQEDSVAGTAMEKEPAEIPAETSVQEAPAMKFSSEAMTMDSEKEGINSGTCGENATWNFDEATGTLTISGNDGRIFAYSPGYYNPPWYGIRKKIVNLVISDGITSIGNLSFYDCSNLVNVFIPDSVSYIYSRAFYNCPSLSKVFINDLNAWCSIVFYDNTANPLSNGCNLYLNNQLLTDFTISHELTSIGNYVFSGWSGLASITIPDCINSIGDYAFQNCSGLSDIIIPESVSSIGKGAFSGCTGLSDISIPDSVISLGEYAFSGCSNLSEIRIPNNLSTISCGLFSNCYNLPQIIIPARITLIEGSAFENCTELNSVILPDSVKSIGSHAFKNCYRLSNINIPAKLTAIGEEAFYSCDNLTNITIPGGISRIENDTFIYCDNLVDVTIMPGVTSIGTEAFAFCTNLTTIYIPDSILSIGNSVFTNCRLDDIYYGGCEEQWSKIKIGHANWNLRNADIHYNSILQESDIPSSFHFVINPNGDNFEVKTGQPLWITVHLYDGDEVVTDIEQPALAFGHTGDEKIVKYIGWEPSGDGGYILNLIGAKPGVEVFTIHDEASDTTFKFSITVTQAEVNEYLDNSEIKINESGSAFAYYISDPYQDFLITVNGNAQSVRSNEKGVFRVPLGTYYINGTENVTVEVTHIGGEELSEPLRFYSTITITPLEFSQSWEASMDASLGAKLIAGAEFEPLKLKASLGEVGGKIGGGMAMNISRSYSTEGETLELTSDKKVEAGLTVKCGITGSSLGAKLESGLSAGVKGSDTITYGLKIEDYSPNNSAQQRAVATYLLGEALFASPSNAFVKSFYNHMAESVYQNCGGIVVHGSASKLSGSFGGGLGEVTVNGVEIASVLTAEVGAAVVQAEKTASDGSQEKSMSANLDLNLSAVTLEVKPEGSENSTDISVLGADFLGRDVTIAAKQSANGKDKTLETTSLSATSAEMKILEVGVPSTAVYNKYIFKDKAMDGLLSNTTSFDDYLNKNLFVLSLRDVRELSDVISRSDAPIAYERENREKFAFSLPLEFGFGLGVDVDFGVTLSYLEDTSYTSATGYAVDDAIFLTSEAVDIKGQVNANKRDLSEVFTSCIQSLANDAANFFKKIGNAIQEGVETIWGWIDGRVDSVHDWVVSLTSPASESAWGESMSIDVAENTAIFSLRNAREVNITRNAMTVGRPFVVTVTDRDTGESVTSFEQEPLEFTIRYAPEDLMAAGYDADTDVISMYRYSDDGDYFECVGGVHDAQAGTVTVAITRPGQYILAAEEFTEESLPDFIMGDVNGDGWVDSFDASLIMKYDVMLIGDGDLNLAAADVSGDGFVDSYDASLILKFDVMLIDKFPVEG